MELQDPRDDRARRRDLVTTAAALVAHVAVIALAWPFAAKLAPPAEAPATQGLIEIDLQKAEEPSPPPPASTAEPAAGLPEVGRADSRGAGGRVSGPDLPPPKGPEGGPSNSAAPEVPSPVAPAPTSEYSGAAPMVPMPGTGILGGTGPLGKPVWEIPGVLPSGPDLPGGAGSAAPSVPVGPRASVAPGKGATLLRDDMRAHAASLGIGTAGGTSVANAVADAIMGSSLPTTANAVIVARIGGDGTVISLTVQQFSAGDAKTWSGVASAAMGALGKKKLGLAGMGSKGAIVQVQVRSVFTYPSGGGGSGGGGESRSLGGEIAQRIADGPDKTVAPAPSPEGDACAPERHSDIPPLCGVGMTVGKFDVTDLATRKHRYVRTSFSVKLLEDTPAGSSAPVASSAPAGPSAVPSAAPAAKADAGAP